LEEYPETLEFFHKRIGCKDNLRPICKVCANIAKTLARNKNEGENERAKERAKLHYHQNKEYGKEIRSKYYHKNKDITNAKRRESNNTPKGKYKLYINRVNREFNLSETDLQQLMDQQVGLCDICGTSLVFPKSTRRYHIDHDHSTGKVRGLLCNNCNTGLGQFKDNIDSLEAAINYLTRTSV